MKRLFLVCVTVMLSSVFLFANGQGEKKSSGKANKQYLIRLGHSNPPDDKNIIQYTSKYFKQKVEEYSNGRIKVEIYPSNQLGSDQDQIRALQNGSQQMTYTSVQNFATFAPPLYCFSLPYLFTSGDAATKAVFALWDKDTDWLVTKGGVRPVAWAVAGFRNLTTDKNHPVRTLDDVKGLKVRIPSNAISEAAFKKLGFEPVPLAYSEVFTALQQGVVSGQENCYTAAVAEHYDEVQKYVIDIQWQYTIGLFAISEEYYKTLPDDLKQVIIKAGKEATQAEIDKFAESDKNDIATLKSKGMKFLGQPADYDKWIELGRSIWPKQYSLIGEGDAAKGKAIVDDVLTIISK